jgi:hypothetical protein
MLEYIGSHYDVLAALAGSAFIIVLAATSIGDALRRSRERRSREGGVAPSRGEDQWQAGQDRQAA